MPGTYILDFGILDAFDGIGDALEGEIGHSFTVVVLVPEPGALGLLGLAAAEAAGWRRRRC